MVKDETGLTPSFQFPMKTKIMNIFIAGEKKPSCLSQYVDEVQQFPVYFTFS